MEEKVMMIDYRDANATIRRKEIDNMEFCVRNGAAYFISDGIKYSVPLEDVIQVYNTDT